MAIYEILASSTSEIQGITCFIIQLFIAEAMFFFHLKKRKRFWLRLLVGGTACLLLGVTLPIIIGQYISGIRTFIVLVFMQLYMWFCFRRSFLDILFCTIGAFTVQNLGSNIQVLICIVTKTSFKMLSTEMVIGFTIVYIICSKNKKFSEYQPEQSPCTLGSHYFLMCLLAPSKLADQ